jgi:biopolymer transport protein ExbB/TolQ
MIDFFVKGGALMWSILLRSVIALALILAKAVQSYGSRKWTGCARPDAQASAPSPNGPDGSPLVFRCRVGGFGA